MYINVSWQQRFSHFQKSVEVNSTETISEVATRIGLDCSQPARLTDAQGNVSILEATDTIGELARELDFAKQGQRGLFRRG